MIKRKVGLYEEGELVRTATVLGTDEPDCILMGWVTFDPFLKNDKTQNVKII